MKFIYFVSFSHNLVCDYKTFAYYNLCFVIFFIIYSLSLFSLTPQLYHHEFNSACETLSSSKVLLFCLMWVCVYVCMWVEKRARERESPSSLLVKHFNFILYFFHFFLFDSICNKNGEENELKTKWYFSLWYQSLPIYIHTHP